MTTTPNHTVDPTAPLVCVFADLVDSTPLWELSEEQMKPALDQFYQLLRYRLAAHNGYEVKVVGDGMFTSFFNPVDALRYCMQVQKDIASTHWPRDILAFRAEKDRQIPKRVGRVRPRQNVSEENALYPPRGLITRLGMHYGVPFQSTIDPTTNRQDYYGNMVNIAARVMHLVKGDEIGVSDATLYEIQKAMNIMPRNLEGVQALDRIVAVTKFLEEIGETAICIEYSIEKIRLERGG